MSPEDRPIGYWLKLLDGLIEASLDQALAAEGATRRQWQALNMIHTAEQGAATSAVIGEALEPFLDDDQGAAHRVLEELIRKGWVRMRPDGVVSPTSSGLDAHARLRRHVMSIRDALTQGVTEGEYLATLRVLRRMAANLQSPDATKS